MDMQRLSQALKAAHAAGDTAAATKLAQEIRRLQQQSQTPNQQPNQTGFLKGAFVNAPVRGGIGIAQGFDARKAAKAAKKAEFFDVSSIENMKRAAASRMNPQLYQKVFESEDGIEYLQYLAGKNLTPKQMLESIQKRNPELGTDFSDNGWAGQINSIFDRYEADKTDKVEKAYSEGEEALSSLAKKEQLKSQFPMSDVGQRGANIYAESPTVMEWAKGAFKDPVASLAFISEIATESAPSIGAGIGTGIITRNPRAAAGIMVLSGAPRTYSGEFVEFLRSQDIDISDPYAIKAAISNDKILAEANKRGFTKAAIVGFFEALGMKAGGGILRQAFAQAGTGSGGELASDVALDGVENIDWKEVVLEGIAELATTPAEYSIIKGRGLFKNGNLSGSEDLSLLPEFEKLAAADVARLLDETAKENGLNLKDINPSSSKGSRQALENARGSTVQKINDLKDVLKKRLDKKNASSLEELLSVYSEAAAGIASGKKKVSETVSEKQIKAIAELVGDTREGQQLVQELVKSNVITNLFKDGMKGGLSQFTDLFNPISHNGAVYDPKRYFNVFVSGFSGVTLGVPTTAAIYSSGRVVDFFTGRRSKVARFVNSNKKALGLPAPEGTSLIEQKNKQKADAKDRRLAVAKIAQLTNAPSSDYLANILAGTGLDRDGLNTVLKDMGEKFGGDPNFKSIIDDVVAQLEGKGTDFLDVLTEFIPVVGHHAQLYFPDLVVSAPDNLLLKRSFDSPNVQTDMPTMGGGGSQFGEQLTTPENYRRGIQDNLDFVRTLQDSAGKDKNLSKVDRGRLITSLENLTNNLGSNPVETVQTEVQKLQDQGVNQDAIDKYVQPYVDRVVRQQRPKGLQAAADAGVAPEFDTSGLSEKDARLINMTDEEIAADVEAFEKKLTEIFGKFGNKKPRLSMEPIEDQPEADRGINVRTDGNTNYANLIVSGKKTYETRDSDSLRPYVGKRVGIVETGSGKAKLVGYATIGEPIKVGEAEFDNLRDKHLVPKGSKFDIKKGGQKYLYPTSNPVALDTPVDASANKGIVARRLNEQSPMLQQPEIPRGETTNIQMPNTLGSAFEFAKNSNFRTGRDFKLALQEKALKAQQEEGIDLSEFTEENVNRLADYVVADALDALQNNSNAIGWYDRTVSQALETLGEVYPEIQTNPVNKLQFIWALAVTSNGTKVDKNFELAATAYDTLQRTGRFPAKIGIGDSAKQIDLGLAQYHTMLEKFDNDHGRLEDFMTSQSTVRELENTYKVKIPDESKDTEVRGAAILGAKIGNGFFSNLYGYFDALTMDRWLMRTVGRHRGTLIKINRPMIKKKHGEIKSIFTNADPSQLKALRAYLKPSGIRLGKSMTKQDMNDLAAYIAKQSTKKPWREGLNEISNDLRKSANGLAGYLDGQVEQPSGGGERNFIRSIFNQALDRVNADPAVSRVSNSGLTMSDLQALLWYPEKRLYDSSKAPEGQESRGYKDDEAPDYANAARKFVEARQGMASGGRLGSSRAAGDGGRGAASPNARLSQQPTGSAGILFRNASQSAASRRPRSDDRNIVPNTSEVKQAAKPVKALIEIGSPNGEFPDGIKDIDGVRRLAAATNITINMYLDQDKLIMDMGFDPTEVRALGAYGDGVAYVLKEGSTRKNQYGETLGSVDSFEEYIAALHEVFHGVNDQLYNPEVLANMDSEARARMEGRIAQGRDMGKNKVTGRKEIVSSASFDSFIAGLTTGKTKVPNNIRKKMLAEMLDLQKNGYFRSQRGSVREIRNRRAMETNPDYKKYVRNAPETAVDVIMYYAHDPKRMKREYPNLAKMVKSFFSQSSKVQFFSHPLAMAIAVVYAMLLKQEQAEEEDQQRGILAQQQAMQAGALTA